MSIDAPHTALETFRLNIFSMDWSSFKDKKACSSIRCLSNSAKFMRITRPLKEKYHHQPIAILPMLIALLQPFSPHPSLSQIISTYSSSPSSPSPPAAS